MVARGEQYAANLDRSTISRWEKGMRLPPREFLIALGRACDIPEPEMHRMLRLAGYDTPIGEDGRSAILAAAQSIESQVDVLQREVRGLVDSTATPAVDASAVVKSALWRMIPPGVYALVMGFVLNAMDMNGTLALLGFVLVAFAIVIGQWVLRLLKPNRDRTEHDHIVDLFFISLFFTLNASLLMGTVAKTDHFGFYTIEAFTNTPMSFLATFLAHLALALAASVMFSVLWKRQQASNRSQSAFERAVWTTLPPLLFTYFTIAIFANLGAWISLMIIFGVLFGAFTTIVALNEPGMALGDVDFALKMAIVVMTLLCSFGVVGSLIAYLEPDILRTTFEFRIIPLREVSADQLGYTPEEGVKLMRLGNLWMSLANIVYLVTVVGGYLLVSIRRAAR